MRCLQAVGYVQHDYAFYLMKTQPPHPYSTSAILSIGAATLADIYEPHERGTMMGIYYW